MSELIGAGFGHDVRITSDIEYAAPNGVTLSLDLYRPEASAAAVPTVLYLHGGGFALGRRTDFRERLIGVAKYGLAVASASYRLTDIATYPAQLHDTRAAVRWLRQKGADFGLATDKIGVWGASAGGTLAMLAGFAPEDDAADEQDSVQAVASWFGATDLTKTGSHVAPAPDAVVPTVILELATRDNIEMPPSPPFMARLVGAEDESAATEELWKASPLAHAKRPGPPPILLMHGDKDGLLPAEHSRWMYDAVKEAGGDARLMSLGGANHEDHAFHRDEALGALAGFFLEHLTS
ncbi:alpha/beta hydrolase [Streptomyces sp. NPDC048430]|uniref:alpha/beta hydrolase n=1 Tax=Streptomyces sp. NPDC048430 TaxID=3155388 RepID=UPI0034401F91